MSRDDPQPLGAAPRRSETAAPSDASSTDASAAGSPKPGSESSAIEGISQIIATLDQLELQIVEYRKMLAEEKIAIGDSTDTAPENRVEAPVDEVDEEALGGVAEGIAAEAAALFTKEHGLMEPTTDDAEVSAAYSPTVLLVPPDVRDEDEEDVDPEGLEEPSVDLPELFSELQSQLDMGLHSTATVSIFVNDEELLAYLSSTTSSGMAPEPQPLFRAFSSGKAMAAATVWRLLDVGVIDIDAPVARYWPEFLQRGKSKVTVRHVLTHTAGLPRDFGRGDVDWGDWGRMSDILASMPLEYEPGKVIHYHTITFGILVAEIASRATGLDFVDLFEREVRRPLGLSDTYFSIDGDDSDTRRRVQSLATSSEYHDREMPFKMDWLLDNQIMSPGATCVTTASDLAKLYSVVCNRGSTGDGEVWLSEDAAERIYSVHASTYDIESMLPARVGQGVWMFDEQPNRTAATVDAKTFGHGGMGTSIAWGDPDHNVGVAIITDTMQEEELNGRRLNRISAAVRRDLGLSVGAVAEL